MIEEDINSIKRKIEDGKKEDLLEEEKYREMIRNTDPHSYWRFCINNLINNEEHRDKILVNFLNDLRDSYNPEMGWELEEMVNKFPSFPRVVFSELIKPGSLNGYSLIFEYFNDFSNQFSSTIITKDFTNTIYQILKESDSPIECVNRFMPTLLTCLRKGEILSDVEIKEIESSIQSFFEENFEENPFCIELYGRTEGIIYNRYYTIDNGVDSFHQLVDVLLNKELVSVIVFVFYEIAAQNLFSYLDASEMLTIFNNILITEFPVEMMSMIYNIFLNLFKNISLDDVGIKLIHAINWEYFAAFCMPGNELIVSQYIKCINTICKRHEDFPGIVGYEPFRTAIDISLDDDLSASIRQKALEVMAFHFPNYTDEMVNQLLDPELFEQLADMVLSIDKRPLEQMVSFTIDLIKRMMSKGKSEISQLIAILTESGYEEAIIDAIEDQDIENSDVLFELFEELA